MLNKQASVTGSSLSPLQCYLLFDNRWHTVSILLPSNTFAVDSTKHKVFGSFLRYTSLKFYLFIWGGMCMQRCMCGALRTICRSHFCPFIMGSWVLSLGCQALAVGTFTYCATLPASSEIFWDVAFRPLLWIIKLSKFSCKRDLNTLKKQCKHVRKQQ